MVKYIESNNNEFVQNKNKYFKFISRLALEIEQITRECSNPIYI